MKKLPVNLGDLALALEDQGGGLDLHSYWLNTTTGEVIFLTEDLEEQDELREQIEENSMGRFVQIDPIDSHEGFRLMADFVDTLPQNRFREKLERCLSGPRPFRRFKDALYENKVVQEKWYQFNNKATQRLAIEWLAAVGIEPLNAPPCELPTGNDTASGSDTSASDPAETATAKRSKNSVKPRKKRAETVVFKNSEEEGRAREAGLEFVARKLKLRHPNGTFDDGGRFYPSEQEWRDCCADIRAPSRAFPYSLMTHCRTAKHLANLYGVSETGLSAEADKVRLQLWYLCFVRDFGRVRSILEGELTVDPFLTAPNGQTPRTILTETRPHGILKRQVWDHLFAVLDDYEKRWEASKRQELQSAQ